ncbi:MAG: argininosuccinate lyase [Phycisphaerae bacterium]
MDTPARRLWDKGGALDALIHRFTVGDDPIWDLQLVEADCLGSAAHARTLARAGLLTDHETRLLLDGLAEILALHRAGQFQIPPELEDVHTAIEAHLTRRCGVAGEKIHTGRSRNDQVATAMRLALRERTIALLKQLDEFALTTLTRIQRDGDAVMTGYTHLQPAMPSSLGQWLHAWVEAALELSRTGAHVFDLLDCCPLGTGAGFGVPLPLDRRHTAELLGFSRVQRSPIDVQNSRGRMELQFTRFAADIGAMIEKLAWDAQLFASREFGFYALPPELTTGSSIMPQKRNPDVLELLRAGGARLRARVAEIEWVCGKLPSSYHRDLQLTKAPALRAARESEQLLDVATLVIERFTIDRERMKSAMPPELYATHATLQRVRAGEPFRQAYRAVAEELAGGRFSPPIVAGGDGTNSAGLTDSILSQLRAELDSLRLGRERIADDVARCNAVLLPTRRDSARPD